MEEEIDMEEIKCPKCGAVFQIDETNYERIASQIRDKEFYKALDEREQIFKDTTKNEVEKVALNKDNDYKDIISEKDLRIKDLEAEIRSLL